MPARTRRRAKFNFRTREFVWWVDADRYLRISSLDKKFVIAFALGTKADTPAIIAVIGQEFPGLDTAEERPVWLVVPEPGTKSMGGWVHELLCGSFASSHQVIRYTGPICFL